MRKLGLKLDHSHKLFHESKRCHLQRSRNLIGREGLGFLGQRGISRRYDGHYIHARKGLLKMKMKTRANARKLALAAAALGVAATMAFSAVAAEAVPVLSVPSNATINRNTGRGVGGAWGSVGPYKVNFQCNVAGCSNFVSSSTNTTSYITWAELDGCVKYNTTATHTITIWESAGAGGSISGHYTTTWIGNGAC